VTPIRSNGDARAGAVLRVLRGEPSDEELAAVVTVLQLLTGQPRARSLAAPTRPAAPAWTRPDRYRPPAAWPGRHPKPSSLPAGPAC